ncbi:MAG: O-antigen ligase family protein [Anaeroplasmataceae bacterium]|nr:O-antigen ligase family protein [Anaeroplasmataceae bacterium]MDE6414488.1 O-antigen ligase family protein [Anaeroplasmataceae bacterium]
MMSVIQEKYNHLNICALKITKMKYFNEIYAAVLALVTVMGWALNSVVGMIVMMLIAAIALILTKDLKYVIPQCIYFIFIFSEGFASDSFPIPIIVIASIFAIIILFFSFRGGIQLKKMKSLIGLAGLAFTTIIPIIWCKVPKGNEVFYFLFFANLGYLLLYIIMTNGIKENGMDLLAVSMSFLTIILACECALKVYELKDTVNNILDLWYFLGWGFCNEAGIMICVAIPFVFYILGKQEKLTGMIYQNSKIIIGIIGILLTTSRGSYIFGLLEIVVLYVALMFISKRARLYQNAFLVYALTIIILILCMKPIITRELEKIMELVFKNGLDDNGRKEVWEAAVRLWRGNTVHTIFGPGIVCAIGEQETAFGVQVGPIVFHSTFFETLINGGVIGAGFLLVHFIQKYWNLKRYDTYLLAVLGTGYLFVDLYGMIDNTYHMYYYMLPLMVIMGTIDAGIFAKKELSSLDNKTL